MTGRKQDLSRRKFLQLAGTGIAGAVLAACAPAVTPLSAPAGAGYSGARHRCDNRAFGRNGCPSGK